MKYNLVTKKNIAIATFIILVIIATVCFDYFRTQNANNQELTKVLQAVLKKTGNSCSRTGTQRNV